jgi:hypothetical protein
MFGGRLVEAMDEKIDLLALDYDGKVKLLEKLTTELLNLRLEFAQIAGRYTELRANIEVLKQVKSALQSVIRAEGGLN